MLRHPGYREAQVAFVRVPDDAQKQIGYPSLRKRALFLVVYAPRRGILEIWSCLYGPRVGAFNVKKNARCAGSDDRCYLLSLRHVMFLA